MSRPMSEMLEDNRRTIELLESLNPIFPEDIAERDHQLRTARKVRELLDDVATMLPTTSEPE